MELSRPCDNPFHGRTGDEVYLYRYGGDDSSRAFSDSVKKELFHPGYICSWCNNEILSIDDAEVDHIVPFSQGGKTDISNAQLLHGHCNREKSDGMDDDDFEDDEE